MVEETERNKGCCSQISNSLLSFHWDCSGRILLRFEHGDLHWPSTLEGK